jgi:hypothetical protein
MRAPSLRGSACVSHVLTPGHPPHLLKHQSSFATNPKDHACTDGQRASPRCALPQSRAAHETQEAQRGSAADASPLAAAAKKYTAPLVAGVHAELAENRRQFEGQTMEREVQAVCADGIALLDLAATPAGRLYGNLLFTFRPRSGHNLPSSKFSVGQSVVLLEQRHAASGGRTLLSSIVREGSSVDATIVELSTGAAVLAVSSIEGGLDIRPGTYLV